MCVVGMTGHGEKLFSVRHAQLYIITYVLLHLKMFFLGGRSGGYYLLQIIELNNDNVQIWLVLSTDIKVEGKDYTLKWHAYAF